MTILGYGEDALTFHALSSGLAPILHQLADDSDPAASLCFFRPSFGRRGSAPGSSPRAEFGEFDAIIGTRRAVYLVEAKWSASSEFDGAELQLRPEQLRRHAAFRTYLQEWRRRPSDGWLEFAARVSPALRSQANGLVPPAAGTTLAQNLTYVLRSLMACGPDIIDVLLFCRHSETHQIPAACGSYCIVTHVCPPVEEGSRFISLSS
jgi:hypothetical protein